ncbi:MAG: VWA domain-containing protein [Thiohalomonas sp.]|nr:VWA domain-containing protein [Thiohalomonas sp.]
MSDAFHFIRPEWFIALPFIALLLILMAKRSKKNNSGWEAVCDPELLAFQLAQQSADNKKPGAKSFQLLHWTIPFLFLIATIALAGPSWEKKEQPVFQQGNALIIILDLSFSMNAKDIKPSRLERAKLKLIDILKQKKEGQTALIAFAGDAHTVSPLTIDNKTIMSLLPALDSAIMPLSGTHLIDALSTAKELFKNAGFAQGDILLITDGIDPSQQNKLEKNIKTLRKQGYHFSIIGVGSQTGSPIPLQKGGFLKDQSGQIVLSKLSPEPLKTLVKLGNGNYHKLSLDDSDFKAIIKHNLRIDKQAIEQNDHLEQWVDSGAYLTLVLIPFALLSFRKGLLSIMLIVFLAPYLIMETAYADEASNKQWIGQFNQKLSNVWDKVWSTADQKGQKAFDSKNYQQAAQSFSNKNWKASAQYRAGEFEQALEQYSQSDDAKSLYNKGNTLANMEKFQDAADAYEQAIKKQPEFDSASKNLDYIKEIITQQKKQQQEQKNSDKNQDKSDKHSENQQQDQQNSTDDASKGNESDSKDSEKNNSDESDSEGSESEKTDEENSQSNSPESDVQKEKNKSDEAQSDKPKSPEDYQQKNAEQNQSNKDTEQQAQAKPVAENETEDKDEDEESGTEETPSDILSQLSQEEQQSLKQWLQRIPDNPGKLLKVKFRNNTLLKQRQVDTETQYEGDPW